MIKSLRALCVCLFIARAQGLEITVFTSDDLPPIRGLEQATAVYTLDKSKAPLGQLTFSRPGTMEQARRDALAQLESAAGRAVLETVRERATAAAMAQWLQIEWLPAVVVSPGYVVYGVYDVPQALRKVEAYRARP